MISKAITYIHFTTNCAEAMSFYQSCFGGELSMMKVSETPMSENMPGMGDLVMHSQLVGEGWAIFASDWCAPSDRVQGNNWSVMIECSSEAEQDEIFAKIGQGGKVSMELSDTFWGSRFAMVKDRFGVDWMLNFTKAG